MDLITPRLFLRDLLETDCAALFELESDVQTWRYEHPPLTESESRGRLERALAWQAETPRTRYTWALTIPPVGSLRGVLKLTLTFPSIREYEIGWAVRREEWGKGYASEAARAVLGFGFEQLLAHRVVAFCHAENGASERVMQKLGMQREGRTRETHCMEGTWSDELLYAILEREFRAPGMA